MSDESDKTVFRQPSATGDRTVIKPMPGGRGGQASPASAQPAAAPLRQPAQPAPAALDTEAAYFRTSRGLNPLVNAASTLIAVFEKTRSAVSHPDVGGLHQRLVNEIKGFEQRAKAEGLKPEIVLSARYVLCAALDEAVLNTPWGSESGWSQRTLLSIFHNETAGGEKFFMIVDRMREYPAENMHILELLYVLLSLGFEGKYRVIRGGRDTIEQIRDELFRMIRSHRGEPERALSQNWYGLGNVRNTLTQYIPMWVVASIMGVILFLSYSGFRFWLYQSSSPVAAQLDQISELRPADKQKRFSPTD